MEIKKPYQTQTKTLNLDYDSLYKISSITKVNSKFIKIPSIFVKKIGMFIEETEILRENSPFKLNIFKNNEKICTVSRCIITYHNKKDYTIIIKPISNETCINSIETHIEKITNYN